MINFCGFNNSLWYQYSLYKLVYIAKSHSRSAQVQATTLLKRPALYSAKKRLQLLANRFNMLLRTENNM